MHERQIEDLPFGNRKFSVVFSNRGRWRMRTRSWTSAARSSRPIKIPRAVQFVADLPKTSTGKIMRRELKTLDV